MDGSTIPKTAQTKHAVANQLNLFIQYLINLPPSELHIILYNSSTEWVFTCSLTSYSLTSCSYHLIAELNGFYVELNIVPAQFYHRLDRPYLTHSLMLYLSFKHHLTVSLFIFLLITFLLPQNTSTHCRLHPGMDWGCNCGVLTLNNPDRDGWLFWFRPDVTLPHVAVH